MQQEPTITFALEPVGCGATLTSITTRVGSCSGVYDLWTSNAAFIASTSATVRNPATWTKVVASYHANRVGAFDTISGIAISLPADVRTGISVVCQVGSLGRGNAGAQDAMTLNAGGANVKYYGFGMGISSGDPPSGTIQYPSAFLGGFAIVAASS
ncbi:hypothetical protein FOA52_015902 [Chlamydomonas sp. UWO 241]|nr:hypothetical protein FOA52_015902 [Chlamydomonas sp. UWO 241]